MEEAEKACPDSLHSQEEQSTPVSDQSLNTEDPAFIAAQMYSTYLPRFKIQVGKLSNNALRRVLNALIEVPLVLDMPKFSTDLEKDVFNTGQALIQAKWMLIQHTMLEAADQSNGSTDSNNNVTSTSEVIVQDNATEVNKDG